MTSVSTSCQAEVLSPTVYCSDLTTSGVSMTAVLVLTALGVLCTRRCFREDFAASGGPTKMDRKKVWNRASDRHNIQQHHHHNGYDHYETRIIQVNLSHCYLPKGPTMSGSRVQVTST